LSEVASHHGAPFEEVANINSEKSAALLQSCRPDVIVSLGNRIIKPPILAIPRLGVLNAHSSLLPKYRGTVAEFWQLVNGETETGVTVNWMAARVDGGAILVQEEAADPTWRQSLAIP
jgi:methionyl-tRNA formyltransferase